MTAFSKQDVHKISHLASIPLTESEEEKLASGFNTVITVVDSLSKVETTGVIPSLSVTGIKNRLREDVVDETRMFSQEEALKNAPRTHNGYIVVDQIQEND